MQRRTPGERRRLTGWAILLLVVSGAGCGQVATPVRTNPSFSLAKEPVVLVPGVTGVSLRDSVTGEYVWGKGKNLIRPHDRGHATARSVSASHPGPQILPAGVILELKLFGWIRFNIYRKVVDHFAAHGYRFGDLERPLPSDDFFVFSYDWRQDNVASAALLAEQLEALRRARGLERLRVNLICQSNGAHICRYFTKYGGLSLEDAESGRPREPARSTVDNLILVGASNGGSIRVLRELNKGRKYVDVIGRRWGAETLFTFASLYQDLPVYTQDLFVDENGQPMDVDLYDADNWELYQWSIYCRETSQRLDRKGLPAWLGDGGERRQFLVSALDRARRFHDLLHRDVKDLADTRYFLVSNMGHDTSSRAVLVREKEGWQTRFGDDRWVRHRAGLRSEIVVAGDGHATAASQRWLSPQEIQRLGDSELEVVGTHRRIILQDSAHEWILQILKRGVPGRDD